MRKFLENLFLDSQDGLRRWAVLSCRLRWFQVPIDWGQSIYHHGRAKARAAELALDYEGKCKGRASNEQYIFAAMLCQAR